MEWHPLYHGEGIIDHRRAEQPMPEGPPQAGPGNNEEFCAAH
eukprot:gene3561-5554_t